MPFAKWIIALSLAPAAGVQMLALTATLMSPRPAFDGDRVIYTTKPQPGPIDGKMIVITLVWQKL